MIAAIVLLGSIAVALCLHGAAWGLRWYIKRKETLKWPKLNKH